MARHGAGATIASGAVLAVAIGFAVALADVGPAPGGGADDGGRRYRALFASAEGLAPGGAVTLAGIEIGRIASIRLDPRSFNAVVEFSVDRAVALRPDASLSVGESAGGAGTLALEPGHGAGVLPAGATITRAQPSRSLEQQVGDYIFGAGGLSGD